MCLKLDMFEGISLVFENILADRLAGAYVRFLKELKC